jgi:hypothetical protein
VDLDERETAGLVRSAEAGGVEFTVIAVMPSWGAVLGLFSGVWGMTAGMTAT